MANGSEQGDVSRLEDAVNDTLAYLRQQQELPIPQPVTPGAGSAEGELPTLGLSQVPGASAVANLEALAKELGAVPLAELNQVALPPVPDPLGPDVDVEEVEEPEQETPARPTPEPELAGQREEGAPRPEAGDTAEIVRALNQLVERVRMGVSIPLPETLIDTGGSVAGTADPGDHAKALESRIAVLEARLRAKEELSPKLLPALEAESFPAILTSSTIGNGTATGHATDPSTKWTYAFSEVEKTAAGYGGWAVLTGGRSGTAHNKIEDINTTTGEDRMGNGVVLENLDYDDDSTFEFAPRPVPANVIVQMRLVEFKVSGVPTTEYWFAYENGTDGACD